MKKNNQTVDYRRIPPASNNKQTNNLNNKTMKLQTTKKAIKNNFNTIISIGYCDAQYLLYFKSPFAYSTGVYGWACDYYQIENVCISTGYNPIGEKVSYELLKELEHKAGDIIHDYSIEHKDKSALVESLLTQLIDSIKKTVE